MVIFMDTEKIKPPEIDKMPAPCPVCDMMITLGLGNSLCMALPANEKNKCQQLMRPLEEKKATAVDTLASILVELGDEQFNSSLDRMNSIIWQATEKAKSELILKGRLNADGTPREMK